MGFGSGLAVYFIIWWTALFLVLPFSVRKAEQDKVGNMPGAPDNPKILKKFIITTIVSLVIFLIIYVLIEIKIIDFRQISLDMVREDMQ